MSAPDAKTRQTSAAAERLKLELLAEAERLGPKLQASIPCFHAFYLVGAAAIGELELVETGSAWLCGSELAFVLVSGASIPGPTLRCLRAGIGLRFGGMRVRIRHLHADWLAQQTSKHREGFELVFARKLLAGDDDVVAALDTGWSRQPAPEAAENLIVDSLEHLLRAWPDAPMLTRARYDGEHERLLLRGALVELWRNLGDALLLQDGSFTLPREERRGALRARLPEPSARARALDWAFGGQPLVTEPPIDDGELWQDVRGGLLDALAGIVARRSGRDRIDAGVLTRTVRRSRRSLRSRLRRLLRGQQRAGGREHVQLLLVLCLAHGTGGAEHKALLSRAAGLLTRLGGPILGNADWFKLRRETLRLEDWNSRVLGRARVPSRIEPALNEAAH